ncbi:MAG TPA: heme A synthase [Gammaproteobacteria bacterium]|jgi:cytochrome c oxidase assembly protein subunit 15|nr:COX15/CtaA family protein [Gammaproteobacteria bacterium]MDP6732535.1 COX15/CtaA family protein [Gammaproteobacteria bacterium]HAJ76984.1 heme A synthase [Gammaproteobacteria bacterium]|tara:strand:+ start:544 stop:1581 length:1038 start_codon:yes stop_codon:yes gene_type:complete
MPKSNRAVIIWLIAVCFTIFSMVVVGGITRLTESGLSMVDWNPVVGIVPPLNESEWEQAFEVYKNYPQYQKVNTGMSLDDFKEIYYWEYGHRVLGRLIGIIYFVPFVLFLMLGKIEKPMVPKLWIGLVLGSLQGVLGWYMVKSGLVDIPRVSHYRLAAHLMLALLILGYLSWLVLTLYKINRVEMTDLFRTLTYTLVPILLLQILYGAFVAGSRAGFGYNTFPLMNGEFLPEMAMQLTPFWLNLLDNNTMLQFLHRWIGVLVMAITSVLFILAWRSGCSSVKRLTSLLMIVVLGQFLLGVLTLINIIPIGLASLHQAGACIVLIVMVWLVYIVFPDQAGDANREP